jgi:NADP-dependent 3-hydroxy acid dehydrogenase YdfG
MKQTNDQVWFITGANTGLGAAIAKKTLNKGYKVVATARKTEGMEKTLGDSPNLLITNLDITNEEQVQTSVNAALEGWTEGLNIELTLRHSVYAS